MQSYHLRTRTLLPIRYTTGGPARVWEYPVADGHRSARVDSEPDFGEYVDAVSLLSLECAAPGKQTPSGSKPA